MLRVLAVRRGRPVPPALLIPLLLVLAIPPGAGGAAPGAEPLPWAGSERGSAGAVVLCPDVGTGPGVFAVPGASALPARLAAAGWQVYAVDPWSGEAAALRGLDGVIEEAYPALLEAVGARAPGGNVVWIGHGLGGVLPVAAADRVAPPAWIAVGTRFDYRLPPDAAVSWARSWAAGRAPDPLGTARVWWTGVREARGARPGSAPAGAPALSTDLASLQALARNVVERPPPAAVAADLLRWYETGVATDRAGRVDRLAGLDAAAGPALLISGASDPLAPPEDVLPALERLPAGADVEYRMLSRVNGHREEYGHLGMLLSRHARRDLDRLVLGWLRGREASP